MSRGQDNTHSCTSFKRPKKVKHSTKRRKLNPSKLRVKSRGRARVDIGLAFERWRTLKAENGLKSDADVALSLLDKMKSLPSSSASVGASDEKIRFSLSEAQTLIEQEVHATVKKNETKLQSLIEAIQRLDHDVNYESAIQKLEARINLVAKRAEALVHMTKKKSPQEDIISSDSEDQHMEAVSQKSENSMECTDNQEELCKLIDVTEKTIKQLHASDEAGSSKKLPPPVVTPNGTPECKRLRRFIKDEPEDFQDVESKQLMEPKAKKLKAEHLPSGDSDSPQHTDSEQKDKLLHPPLPSFTIPSNLNMQAASYNIPQRLEVHLALIRNPPGLSVLWNVAEKDYCAPPMDSYSVFMAVENEKGSGVFKKWNKLDEVKAFPLPVCVMVSKYRPGRKVCVTVVGKDQFGRYGPFSKVVTAAIPD
ncbi:activating transcription factor 7-interacting protein 2 isoform X2 [Pempheris klunzingeri]|uniref:activating transcription factor 7-interacting protein 2 isoform X2 n=1 Tax=Pempheris klunzingeri TaxID=3127111 RepID=UPI00397F577B